MKATEAGPEKPELYGRIAVDVSFAAFFVYLAPQFWGARKRQGITRNVSIMGEARGPLWRGRFHRAVFSTRVASPTRLRNGREDYLIYGD